MVYIVDPPDTMNCAYVIIENGEPYEKLYRSFASAKAAVTAKYKEAIDEQRREADGEPICSTIDEPEDTVTGRTYLYIEKGITIYIYKLPIEG